MNKFCCGTCRWYRDQMCWRMPPTPILDPVNYTYLPVRPNVNANDDLCGEWEKKNVNHAV